MAGDERKADREKRIKELQAVKPADFTLRDKLTYSQEDMELWGDVMADIGTINTERPNLARMRRFALTAAYNSGWFVTAPKLESTDFILLPPTVVNHVGDAVLTLYNEIVNPDPSFT